MNESIDFGMKKLKLYFYLIYVIFLVFCSLVAVYYEDLVLNMDWDPIDTWTGLIRFVLKLGGVGLVLLIIEVILENIHLFGKNRKIKSLEKEILELKAKMYDQVDKTVDTEEEIIVVPEEDNSAPEEEKPID